MIPIRLIALGLTSLSLIESLIAEEYTIELSANGEQIAVVELSIGLEEATAKVGDVTELFDLKNQRWQDNESKQWVSLSDCENWAKRSKEKSTASSARIPEKIRPFMLWSLDPMFMVESKDSTVTLTSGQIDYAIVTKTSEGDLTGFFRYARLNSYKKAMTDKKLPPFAELKVLDELERRKLLPASMQVKITGVEGGPTFSVIYREKAE